MTVIVRDSNGAELKDGDSVTLIKDLKVKGSSIVLKRGTMIKNIRLTDDSAEIECRAEKVKDLVLRTEFVKRRDEAPISRLLRPERGSSAGTQVAAPLTQGVQRLTVKFFACFQGQSIGQRGARPKFRSEADTAPKRP